MLSKRSVLRLVVSVLLALPVSLWGTTLTLSPAAAGPNVPGTGQTMTAVLKDSSNAPISGVLTTFTITGANARTGTATTDSTGTAVFTYTGSAAGTDTVKASATVNSVTTQSNTATISWVTPARNISSTTVTAKFFTSDNSGIFHTLPSQTPAFTQSFPTINFNPPSGTVPGNTSGVTVNTRPMADITTGLNGNFTGSIVAQGGGFSAGIGALNQLNAVFTGTFTVAAAGNITFNFFSDDGFIFGIGNGATRVSGSNVNPPASGLTPFQSYPVMGALNGPNSPTAVTVVVHFPGPGAYPYEIDYTECCAGQLSFTMTTSNGTTNVPVPPSGTLTMTPATVASQRTGTSVSFTVMAANAANAAVGNLPVTLTITGVNPQTLTGTTNASGKVSFSYSGTHGTGTDHLQASAVLTGMLALSNNVNVSWNSGTNLAPVVSAGTSQTVNLPASAVLTGTVTDDGLPAGAAVTPTWSKVSGPGTVTFSDPNAVSTLATFSAAGSYVLKLSASDTALTGSSQVTVTVTANPAVSLSPASLTFAGQLVNSASAAQTVTLTNSGSGTLNITSIAATGDFSQTNTCGASVAAAGTCTISVIFRPTVAGARTGSISVTDNVAGSPQSVALSGTGTVAPAVSLSPASLTFAGQAVNTTSAAQTITLTNSGSAALSITSIAASGDFSQTNTCGVSVAAAGSCTISVTFTPTAGGARTGTVTITDNAAGSPHTVSLSGTGTTAPAVSLSPSTLTFASQLVGTTSTAQSITLTNSGSAALSITSIAASGDFSQTNTCGASVSAAGSCTISVTFTPTAGGARTGAVTVTDNAAGSPHTVSLSGTGTTAPAVSLPPSTLTFASQLVGTTSTAQSITLTNSGSATLNITSIAASGDFSQTNTCGASVAAAGTCTISVTFTPIAGGARTSSVTVTDNASGSPHTVSLSGTGTTAPAVSLSPSALTFASQLVGTTSAAQSVTLTNSGSAALSITSIAASGDFSQTNTCGASVAAAGTCTISVTFTPTAGGARTGSVTITDNAAGSPHTVLLSGTGTTAPSVSLSPSTLTFASQLVGTTSAAQTITLTNSGSATLSITSIAASGDFSQTNTCGVSVAAAGTCTISVTFTPTAGGTRTGSVTVTDNASGSPHTVSLTGTGTANPVVSLSPASLTFALQPVNTSSAAQSITLTNTGGGVLNITSIAAGGDFSQTNTCGASVAAAASCTISVTFTPTNGGTRSGSITITDNAANSPQIVALTGSAPIVTVTPSSVTLLSGQTQQFNSIVGLANTSVTWSVTGAGSISVSGLYTAPACVVSQQIVTVTATSVADPSKSASATVTLQTGNPFAWHRAVVIDHTRVANTDQINFPVLVNVTDRALATTTNGGHLTNASGYDLIFASDSSCSARLDHEVESWNPVTGQLTAWVQLPIVSHTADTVLYLCYGNPAITTDQSNRAAVWDSNYKGVWHLANGSALSVADSTGNAGNGAISGALAGSGLIDGAGSFNGATSYISLPQAAFNFPTSGTTTTIPSSFELWFKTAASGGLLGQTNGALPGGGLSGWVPALYLDSNGNLRASLFWHGGTSTITSALPYNDNLWHQAVDTYSNGVETLFVDGVSVGSRSVSQNSYSASYSYFLGSAPEANWPNATATWAYLNGLLDEVRVSNISRSSDWIATGYNNVSSPGTFLSLEAENSAFTIIPGAPALYAAQTQQFSVTSSCGVSAVNWSVTPAAGSINAAGLYTAPAVIAAQQTVTVTATSQTDPAQSGSATVTLYPPVSVSVAPATATLAVGQTQQFAATVNNSASAAVTWTITPANLGSITGSGRYTAPATLAAQQTVTVTATSVFDPSKSGTASIVVEPFAGAPSFFPPPGLYAQPESIAITSASPAAQIRYTTDGTTPTATTGTLYTGPVLVSGNTTIKAIAFGAGLADSSVITSGYTFLAASGSAQFLLTDATTEGSWQGIYGRDGYNVIGGTTAYPAYVTVTPSGQSTFIWNSNTTDVRALESSATGNSRVAGTWFQSGSFTVDFNFTDGLAHQLGLYLLDWDTTSRSQTITALDAANNAILDIRNASNFSSGEYLVWVVRGHIKIRFTQTGGPNAVVSGLFFDPTGVTVSPGAVTLSPNQSQQFTTLVTNSPNTAVTWSASLGSVSSSGLYTAPASVPTEQTATVTATSVADPSKSGTASVLLLPGVTGGGFDQVVPILSGALCRRPHVAPVINAGPDQYVTLGGCNGSQCSGVVTVTGSVLSYTLEPGFSLAYGWSVLSGPGPVQFGTPAASSSAITVTTPGVYTVQLTVDDGASASSAVTHVYVNPANFKTNGFLSISPSISGPNALNTSASFQARFIRFPFGIATNATIHITVTGANPLTANVISDNTGIATFIYTGVNPGVDTINATLDTGTLDGSYNSNTATVTWVNAPANLTTSSVTAQFFPADGSGVFNTPAGTLPAFTQLFPGIDFNPAAGTVTGNTSAVTTSTRPFTDIVTDRNGNFAGSIAAQSAGYKAGAGPLYAFSGVFTGTLNVPAAGPLAFTITSDDGFIFGVGNGATRISGPQANTPATSPFRNYAVMGGVNQRSAPAPSVITVNFPAAGAYPYEMDYAKGGDRNLTLTMKAGGAPIPAAALLTLTPVTAAPITGGQIQIFTLTATDSDGIVIPNLPVEFTVTGENAQTRLLTTDGAGQAGFAYAGSPLLLGADTVQAAAHVNGSDVFSNSVTVIWNNGINQAPIVNAGPAQVVTLPAQAILGGSVSDDGLPGNTVTSIWSMVSGPGTVTFDDVNDPITSATFSAAGTYVLQLSATDGALTGNSTVTVTVNPITNWSGGWIANPINMTTVNGQVPVTLVPGITLTSGTLTFYPASNFSAVTTLNASTVGTGQIGTFDSTLLPNGSYWIDLRATNSLGVTQDNLALVTVAGDYKPGRVVATVTDMVVPAPGMPIEIQRTYDSLTRTASGDFGFGWTLGVNVQMDVSPMGDVTFTLNGQRRVFHFTPQPNSIFTAFYQPQYTPEPGLFGSLVNTGDNCSGVLIHIGNLFECAINNAGVVYQASGYRYTDPYGRAYTVSSTGALRSVQDLNGNTLTVTAGGITSSTGLNVAFTRDAQGRIISILDPLGHAYTYSYDAAGMLVSVGFPGILQSATYEYDSSQLLLSETDPRGSVFSLNTYDSDGRWKSTTDAVGNTINFSYDLATRTTTYTYPDGGVASNQVDAYGNVVRSVDQLGGVRTFAYDSAHNLVSETDPLGNVSTHAYDPNGRLISDTDPMLRTTRYTLNASGDLTQSQLPSGNIITNTYDERGNLTGRSDTLGFLEATTYDQAGRIATQTSIDGETTTFTYGSQGFKQSETASDGQVHLYTYDDLGHLTGVTEPGGLTVTHSYDAIGNRISSTNPGNDTEHLEYDANGNLTAKIDELGRRTTFIYDAANRLIRTTLPDGTSTLATYDFRDRPLSETDQLGRVTTYQYDKLGQLVGVTSATGTAQEAHQTFTYDAAGRKTAATDARGMTTHYSYDASGKLASVVDPAGALTQFGYDAAGRLTAITDGAGRVTTFTPNARDFAVDTLTPGGLARHAAMTGSRLTSLSDQAGNGHTLTYDRWAELTSVTDAASLTTRYSYDQEGNLNRVTDANGHQTEFGYDNMGRLNRRTWPDGTAESFTYDASSNLVTMTSGKGTTDQNTYDSLDRLTSIHYADGKQISITYTATGNRETVTSPSGTTTYEYDANDRVTRILNPQGMEVRYGYDEAGNRTSITSPAGIVTYTYDADNRVTSVTDFSGGVTHYYYDQTGLRTRRELPNGIVSIYSYDADKHLTGITNQLGANPPVGSDTVTRGPAGNVLSLVDQDGRTTHWTVDNAYRVTGETVQDQSQTSQATYTYDAVGNRLSSNLNGQSSVYQYNAADQILSVGGATYNYDANGNVLQIVNGGSFNLYSYDSANRLVSAQNPAGVAAYSYDSEGRRVGQVVNGVTTRYLWDEFSTFGDVVAETDSANALVAGFVYGADGELLMQRRGADSYVLQDALGNVAMLADPAGTITDRFRYDAFGNIVFRQGGTIIPYRYRAMATDDFTGLIYMRARYYDPITGRFLTRDPEPYHVGDPLEVDRYLYAGSDPVNAWDPTGREVVISYALLKQKIQQELVNAWRSAHSAEKGLGCVEIFKKLADVFMNIINGYESDRIGAVQAFWELFVRHTIGTVTAQFKRPPNERIQAATYAAAPRRQFYAISRNGNPTLLKWLKSSLPLPTEEAVTAPGGERGGCRNHAERIILQQKSRWWQFDSVAASRPICLDCQISLLPQVGAYGTKLCDPGRNPCRTF